MKKGGTRKKNTEDRNRTNLEKEYKKIINKIKRLEKSLASIGKKIENYESRLEKKREEAIKLTQQSRIEEGKLDEKQKELYQARDYLENLTNMIKGLNMKVEIQNLKNFNKNSKTSKLTRKSKIRTY